MNIMHSWWNFGRRLERRDYRDIFENVENLKLEIRKYIISDWDKILDQKVLEKNIRICKDHRSKFIFPI